MARTSAMAEARQRARALLASRFEDRRKREQAELNHATDFAAALAHRATAETNMATAVAHLIWLGNTVVEIVERTEPEIWRLRELAATFGHGMRRSHRCT